MILRSPIWADAVLSEAQRSTRKAALITSVLVVLGFLLTTWVVPSVSAPADVARTYLEDRFARDWASAWRLLCRSARSSVGDYTTYAAASDYWFYFMPKDVDVSVTNVRAAVHGRSPAARFTLTVSDGRFFGDGWERSGDLIVVDEDGEFRVCSAGSQPLVE